MVGFLRLWLRPTTTPRKFLVSGAHYDDSGSAVFIVNSRVLVLAG